MATYEELDQLQSDSALLVRAKWAVIKAADNLLDGETAQAPLTAIERTWILSVVNNPAPEAERALRLALANNSDQPVASLTALTEEQIQTGINRVVPSLIKALAGE